MLSTVIWFLLIVVSIMSNRYPPLTKKSLQSFIEIFKTLPNQRLTIVKSLPDNLHEKSNIRKAAVLIPLCHRHGVPSIIFTLRSTTVGTHRGQVSFPGGHIEQNETPIEAALRETNEELGTGIGNIDIVGICQTIPAITGTLVTPVLGIVAEDVKDFDSLTPNKAEVSRIFTRSLDLLFSPGYRKFETKSRNEQVMTLPYFGEDGHEEKIWGLTAVILDSILNNILLHPVIER